MGYGILKSKVAIVTGSGTGIGKGIALKFADEGAKVVVNYSKSEASAKQTVQEIKEQGGEALAVRADVTKAMDVNGLVTSALKEFGKIDILVNNSGVYIAKPFLDLTEDQWDSVLNTNLKSMFLCSKRVIPEMLRQGKGRIVNIASTDSVVGEVDSSDYCASKGGVMALTFALALEFGPRNITVNAIAPGIIETPMTSSALNNPAARNELISRIPVRRVGKPSDVAEAALFFVKDGTEFITGTLLFVDGGWMADCHAPPSVWSVNDTVSN